MTPSRTATPTPTRPVKPPLRRTPLTLLLFLLAGFACLVAVLAATIIIYIGQDAYKAGHQSTPTGAAEGFLDAMLNEHDVELAENYACDNKALHLQLAKTVSDIKKFESRPDSHISYLWDGFKTVSRSATRARLTSRVSTTTTVNNSIINNPPRTWKFSMRNESGWKVCGLTIPPN
jgi:hypothetical protein